MSQKELQSVLGQLQQAQDSHQEWFANLNRNLVCCQPHDPNDLREDAHRCCRFGQWLYNSANPRLQEHPAFAVIEEEHHAMHRHAARLLTTSIESACIVPAGYDRFATSLQQLRFEMDSLARELQESLYNLDPLTGANTRIGMLTKLREQQELARRGVQCAGITMMDLDHFKSINDRYGHPAGDAVLKATVRYLLEHLRVYDKVFRYGGEEFIIVMPAADCNMARPIVERLRRGISGQIIALPGQDSTSVTASFGLTVLDPDVPVEHSIARADQALYAAKAAGRNGVRVWEPSMSEETRATPSPE